MITTAVRIALQGVVMLGVIAGIAACGHSAPTLLHALVPTAPATAVLAYAGPTVRLDTVRLPAALDRIELLREIDAGRYTVREADRWAAPPARLARQVLAEDIALRLPTGAVAVADAGEAPVTAITVEILEFRTGPEEATLVANWTRACRPNGIARRRDVRLTAPGSDTPEALGALLSQLSDRIAADLAAEPGLGCSSTHAH